MACSSSKKGTPKKSTKALGAAKARSDDESSKEYTPYQSFLKELNDELKATYPDMVWSQRQKRISKAWKDSSDNPVNYSTTY